jgi:hypothetical protein
MQLDGLPLLIKQGEVGRIGSAGDAAPGQHTQEKQQGSDAAKKNGMHCHVRLRNAVSGTLAHGNAFQNAKEWSGASL